MNHVTTVPDLRLADALSCKAGGHVTRYKVTTEDLIKMCTKPGPGIATEIKTMLSNYLLSRQAEFRLLFRHRKWQ